MPCAGFSLLQPAPTDPLQDKAEPRRQGAGTLVEMYSRKSKMLLGKVTRKGVRSKPAVTKVSEE